MTDFDLERVNGIPIARMRGDIDAANANRLRDRLADCMGNDVETLVLDLSDTRYVDSAGIDMLFRFNERLRQRRARLMLVIPQRSQLTRLAELVGLPRAMPVHASVQEALAVCGSGSGSTGVPTLG